MRNLIFSYLLITTAVITANAQFFVEGSVNVEDVNTKITYDVPTHSSASVSSFTISPQVGYWLNDNIALGVKADFSKKRSLNKDFRFDPVYIHTDLEEQNWIFSVFGRYKLWGTPKLSLFIETPVGFGRGSYKGEIESTFTNLSASSIFIRAYPLVSYVLTEKFNIITRCDFLSLGYSSSNSKFESGRKHTSNHFNFNAHSSLFDSLGDISIGFMYKFYMNTRIFA